MQPMYDTITMFAWSSRCALLEKADPSAVLDIDPLAMHASQVTEIHLI